MCVMVNYNTKLVIEYSAIIISLKFCADELSSHEI
jgi:hypothetical protein